MTSLKKQTISGTKWLTLIAIIIIASNIINIMLGEPSWQITRLIDLDAESNIPTWFSSVLLFIAAFFAYRCSLLAKTRQNGKTIWQILSLGLLAMSCDEVAAIHEHLGQTINKYFFHLNNLKSEWVVFVAPFIILVILTVFIKLRYYLNLSGSSVALRFLTLGLIVYVFGSIIVEFTGNFFNYENSKLLYATELIIEESSEMFGAILIIRGLLEHHGFALRREHITGKYDFT